MFSTLTLTLNLQETSKRQEHRMVKTIIFLTSMKYHRILIRYFKDHTDIALNVCRKLSLKQYILEVLLWF